MFKKIQYFPVAQYGSTNMVSARFLARSRQRLATLRQAMSVRRRKLMMFTIMSISLMSGSVLPSTRSDHHGYIRSGAAFDHNLLTLEPRYLFRFQVSELSRIVTHLNLPSSVKLPSRERFEPLEGLMIVCLWLAFPNRWGMLCKIFDSGRVSHMYL